MHLHLDQQFLESLVRLGAGLVLSWWMTLTLRLYRRVRYLKGALARIQQQRIADVNETWKIASTSFASGEPLSLEDLLSKREADFRLTSSRK
jgi:hypothetical protein